MCPHVAKERGRNGPTELVAVDTAQISTRRGPCPNVSAMMGRFCTDQPIVHTVWEAGIDGVREGPGR